MDTRGFANHYYNKRWGVIPLKHKSKTPKLPKDHGLLHRIADEQELESFDFQNVGIVTGAVSGIMVLDIDDEESAENFLEEQGYELPETVSAKTPNGKHYYFSYPAGHAVGNKIKSLPGMDVKGDGGYVVAPPSIVSKEVTDRKGIKSTVEGSYEWINSPDNVELAECPQWLLDELRRQPERSTQQIVEEEIPEGSRNTTLFRLARSFFQKGLGSVEVGHALYAVNQTRCKPPLDEEELFQIVESAGRYERGTLEIVQGETSKEGGEIGTLMSDVKPEIVEWLWEGRIPLGKITVLDGDPGLGKSVITMDLAARVSSGQDFPNGNDGVLGVLGNVGGVVILSAEDGLADTIRPRLDAAGAAVSRVVAVSTVPDGEGNERSISIPEDLEKIEKAINRVNAKLIIIDPLMAFLSDSSKANYDQDVRRALTPLSKMAERTGAAVLVVRHLNKSSGGKAVYRGGGSIGIIGAARCGLVVEEHPDDKDQRVLSVTKSNLAEKATSLTYSVVTAENHSARVAWGNAIDLTADELLESDNNKPNKQDAAAQWLENKLSSGPVLSTEIRSQAKQTGIADRTLDRAKKSLGVEAIKNGSWYWQLQDCQERQERQDADNVTPLFKDELPI